MTCKENCLYYEVCSQFSKADGANCKYYDFSNQAEKCECFKDKSEYIHLPCKVGDTMWKLCTISSRIKFGDMWDGRIVKNNCDRCGYRNCYCYDVGLREHDDESMIDIVEPKKIKSEEFALKIKPYVGTIWFKTREAAERALEEGKNK